MNIRNPLLVPRDQRRGVLLLVVLSLLVLFLMIGTAFIITAKQSEKAAKVQNVTALRAGSQAAQGQLLDEVVRQLVRDTGNPHSALRTHSLLADMYGHGGFVATIGNVQWAKPLSYPPPIATGEVTTGPAAGMRGGVTGGQLVQFELSPAMAPGGTPAMGINGVAYPLSPVDGAYNGQVLTFISSPPNGANARGVSTRIVDYRMFRLPGENPVRDHWQVTVLAFPLADGSPLDDGSVTNRLLQGLNGSTILVNGRPFSGTGVGLNPNVTAANQPKLNAAEQIPNVTLANGDLPPIALLPNAAFMQPSQVQTPNYFPPGSEDITGRGGPNESYDAVDFQNMFLALLPPEPVESQPLASGTLSGMVIPSFHRPELLNYWRAETLAAGGIPLPVNAALLRRVMLRPNWLDHELFTGSNPEYAESLAAFLANRNDAAAQAAMLGRAIYGPWDVDNDNDGVRDSIWIDAGLPVIEGPLGRPVKPLVAILCVDLDGRGNVNVHGTADLAGQGANKDWLDTATDGVRSSQTPRGVGWGPAEISLEPVLGRDSFANLLRHRDVPVLGTPNGIRHVGRYGENEAPGRLNMLDMLTQVTLHGWPQWGAQVPRSLFASPPDLKARYGVGLNALGQPILEATLASERGSNRGRLTADSPYEARLFGEGATSHSGPDAIDAPFSLAELERVLRAYDLDAQALPRRLSVVAGACIPDPTYWAPNSPHQRNMITTDSWDVPTPSVAMPPEWAPLLSPLTGMNSITNLPYQRRLPRTPAELLEVRVRHAIWPGDDDRKFPEPLQG
ncbi:MAG TPA: hypothetical protein PJ982_17015, partial [Lacipirellulaceae bacterium]|nr:hypothetical protein [Lacipirellulaceae bacterium]